MRSANLPPVQVLFDHLSRIDTMKNKANEIAAKAIESLDDGETVNRNSLG